MRRIAIVAGLHYVVASLGDESRPKWCPEPWESSQCLGTSGSLVEGQQVEYDSDDQPIVWADGLKSHSHYKIDPKTTALFVIDPQEVYAKCPKNITVPDLVKPPSTPAFDGHSPLCCERFGESISNVNKLATQARKLSMPVFLHAHVYRDLDGSGQVNNCGRICDFDTLGWAGWPRTWNLWSEKFPWHSIVYQAEDQAGFAADFKRDFYAEKTTYSALTQPVAAKLKALGVNAIIVTGYMTQYCCVTTSRHGHDLGFRIIFVSDACDGPVITQLLSGVDENVAIPFYLGIAVVDTTTTDEILKQLSQMTESEGLVV